MSMKLLNPILVATLLAAVPMARAQRGAGAFRDPTVGYIYPAGAQRGTTTRITVGGQYLQTIDSVRVSGSGVRAKVLEHDRPLNPREVNEIRGKLDEARKKMGIPSREKMEDMSRAERMRMGASLMAAATESGVSIEKIKEMREMNRARNDPDTQEHPHLAETVTLEVEIAANARLGRRELRIEGGGRLSNPMAFMVGALPEHLEQERNDDTPEAGIGNRLPVVINGQIVPGDIDRFAFTADKGDRLVVACAARELIPYLADAVPGWFQATLTLRDADGAEVSSVDDYHFNPDPVLTFGIPADGRYSLEIKDAIYRGREDFVYRITLGRIPFVTGMFPLGGRAGTQTEVEVRGINLPAHKMTVDAQRLESGVTEIAAVRGTGVANPVPFAVDALPESLETEPNDRTSQAQTARLPMVINGRIGKPGDWDVFAFEGRAGQQVVAEVKARRLNSPLDSVLRITDSSGRQLAVNDDFPDKEAGLVTHHADSRVAVALPADGTYYAHLGDTQGKGGWGHAYRLHIRPAQPDFALRVVPSAINAQPGASVPITVYAIRRDGFTGDIELSLEDAPRGFELSGAVIPGSEEKVRLTLTVPSWRTKEPIAVSMEGRARISGREVVHAVTPAEDMMQAFIYRHLVPAESLLVSTIERGRPRQPLRLRSQERVRLQAGRTAQIRFQSNRRLGYVMDRLDFELSDPPPGVTLADVSFSGESLALNLATEAAGSETGSRGNLIVNIFIEMTPPKRRSAPDGTAPPPRPQQKRRILIGSLPAIPYHIAGS
jgi:hypothetical protein